MPTRVWHALVGVIVVLVAAVVGLDQWQARRGEASLFQSPWPSRGSERSPVKGDSGSFAPGPRQPSRGPRVAVIVDELGSRRDVLESLRRLGRPVAVAILPGRPHSQVIAREASVQGMEVLLDLPMEPYRYPQVDPGPGAVLMSTPQGEIRRLVARHLETLPGVVGVTNHMGSRLTEDRAHMRAILSELAARRLFLVDGYASNLSVAYDEARAMGVRAARRHIAVEQSRSEGAERASWSEVTAWTGRHGEAIVIAHGQPQALRLLQEYIPRWEAAGLRLVPVSELAH